MKRALTLGLVLLATAASATDLSPSREALGQKTQWAPSGNFAALHGRAVFRGEIRSESRPYARARGEVASGIGIFLSRDSVEGKLNSAPSLHRFAYGNFNPLRYTDPTGHCFWDDYNCSQAAYDLYKAATRKAAAKVAAEMGAREAVVVEGGAARSPFPENSMVMSSPSELMGVEKASPELISRMTNPKHGRTISIARENSDEMRYLDYMQAEANVGERT